MNAKQQERVQEEDNNMPTLWPALKWFLLGSLVCGILILAVSSLHRSLVTATTVPVVANAHATEEVQVAVSPVTDVKPARPIVAFGHSTTLPQPLWPYLTNILACDRVFKLWVTQSLEGTQNQEEDVPANETHEQFLERVRLADERFDVAANRRAEAERIIGAARNELFDSFGTNRDKLTPIYYAWCETNMISRKDLAQLQTAMQNAWFAATNGIAGKNPTHPMDSL